MSRINIDIKEVADVYSGKPGCMCGCLGKYSYASDWVVEGGLNRGYPVEQEDVSDRSIKIISGKLMKYINGLTDDQFEKEIKEERITINSQYIFAEIESESGRWDSRRRRMVANSRYLCAYFKNHEKAAEQLVKKRRADAQRFMEMTGG